MAKFVELHYEGDPILINLDKVETVEPMFRVGSVLLIDGHKMLADESYKGIKKIIGSALGGIPMEPGRMYDGA